MFILILETSLKRISHDIEKVTGNMIECSALLIPKLSIGYGPKPLPFN